MTCLTDLFPFGRRLALLVALAAPLAGCPLGANSPESNRPPKAQKWYERATREYQSAEVDAAQTSVRRALDIVPQDDDVRMLAARIALARLEFDEVLRLLEGLQIREAYALRGRAYWYKGELDRTARELDRLLDDPEVSDPWASAISKLAHGGSGRRPFEIATTDGRLESVEMARVAGVPLFVLPLEIDGDRALALVSTGTAEVMIDSATRREPSWVSLRFGERLEVKDVPALTQDLSELSMKLGVPIKALLGTNLLRHLNVTLDHGGRQFVARSFAPPPPPVASRVDLFYLRGGGMVFGSTLGDDGAPRASLFIDSSMGHSVALDRAGWKKVGVDANSLPLAGDGDSGFRTGAIPLMQFGAFKLPQIPAVFGAPIDLVEKELQIDIDGVVGAGLLSEFRLTFADGGRVLWIEQRQPVVPPPAGNAPPSGLERPEQPGLGGDYPSVLVPGGEDDVPGERPRNVDDLTPVAPPSMPAPPPDPE